MVCVGSTRTAAAKGGNVSAQIRHSEGLQISVGETPAFHVRQTKSGRKINTLSAVHECSPARPRMNQTSAKHLSAKSGQKLVPDENQITKICVPYFGLIMSGCDCGGDINKSVFGNFESARNQLNCKKNAWKNCQIPELGQNKGFYLKEKRSDRKAVHKQSPVTAAGIRIDTFAGMLS